MLRFHVIRVFFLAFSSFYLALVLQCFWLLRQMLRFSGLSIISIFSGAMISYQNHSLIRHHHKLFTTTLQLTYLIDENCQIFWKIQNLTFSIYVNTNVMQELVNIEKPCILFFNKKCTRGSLMIQYTNLDLKENLQCIFTSNEMVSTMHIHK